MSEETPIKPDSYSVKTTSDVTGRIQELTRKTGLSHKDLFAAMVTRFYTELETGSEIDQSDDMQQIRYHLNRVENIFLGSLQKVQDLKKDYTGRLEGLKTQQKDAQEEIRKQRDQFNNEIEKLVKQKQEAERLYEEVLKRNKELEDTNRTNRMTIDVLGNKVKELETKLSATLQLKETLAQLQEENLNLKQEIATYQGELDSAHESLSMLEQELTQSKEHAEAQLNKILIDFDKEQTKAKLSFNKELQQLGEIHKLERDKTLLEAERKLLEREQAVKIEYDHKIDQLLEKNDRLLTKNQELTERIYAAELELRERQHSPLPSE